MKTPHVGNNFDAFLREENLLDVTEATALKRVIAFQISQEMKRRTGDQVRDGKPDEDKLAEATS